MIFFLEYSKIHFSKNYILLKNWFICQNLSLGGKKISDISPQLFLFVAIMKKCTNSWYVWNICLVSFLE